MAEWQGVRAGRGDAIALDVYEESVGLPDAREPSPHDALRWKEYLLWLLRASAALTVRQRSAFLLHSTCLREMELIGLAGVRRTAALLEIPAERMAELWGALPLDDRAIGALLGLENQQVINLRKVRAGYPRESVAAVFARQLIAAAAFVFMGWKIVKTQMSPNDWTMVYWRLPDGRLACVIYGS